MNRAGLLTGLALAFAAEANTPATPTRPATGVAPATAPVGLSWGKLDSALLSASKSQKPVFLMVEAEWCGYCRRMHAVTFKDRSLSRLLVEKFHNARLDGESNAPLRIGKKTVSESQWASANGVQGFPNLFVLDAAGRVVVNIPGYLEAPELRQILEAALRFIREKGPERKLDFNAWYQQQG